MGMAAGALAVVAVADVAASPAARVLVNGGAMMDGNAFKAATIPAMRAFYGECRRVALVLHASHPPDRDRMERRLQAAFAAIDPAIHAESLHRHDAAGALELLRAADGIFIGGGDTFVLLKTLQETGQLGVIRERVLAGVPTGGSSAGANVMGPVIGTTNDFPVADVATREALAVFPALINPHHPKADAGQDFASREWKLRNYLRWNPDERVLALGDAATAVLKDGEVTLMLGPAWLYRSASESRVLVEGEVVPELATGAR